METDIYNNVKTQNNNYSKQPLHLNKIVHMKDLIGINLVDCYVTNVSKPYSMDIDIGHIIDGNNIRNSDYTYIDVNLDTMTEYSERKISKSYVCRLAGIKKISKHNTKRINIEITNLIKVKHSLVDVCILYVDKYKRLIVEIYAGGINLSKYLSSKYPDIFVYYENNYVNNFIYNWINPKINSTIKRENLNKLITSHI